MPGASQGVVPRVVWHFGVLNSVWWRQPSQATSGQGSLVVQMSLAGALCHCPEMSLWLDSGGEHHPASSCLLLLLFGAYRQHLQPSRAFNQHLCPSRACRQHDQLRTAGTFDEREHGSRRDHDPISGACGERIDAGVFLLTICSRGTVSRSLSCLRMFCQVISTAALPAFTRLWVMESTKVASTAFLPSSNSVSPSLSRSVGGIVISDFWRSAQPDDYISQVFQHHSN